MQVNKNGTMYDVYVKNDYFYKKAYSDGGGKLDLSIDDYMRKVQDSIPELKDVSIGDISIHILPENGSDKSSSSTDDAKDDIIGVVSSKYSYSGDETMRGGTLESKNAEFNISYDKSSVQNLLDKIRFIYSTDKELSQKVDKYTNPYNFLGQYTKNTTTNDGLKGLKFEIADDPLAYEIANLNAQLKFDSSVSSLFFKTLKTKDTLEKITEEMKQNNINTLLNSNNAPINLSSILRTIDKEKKEYLQAKAL